MGTSQDFTPPTRVLYGHAEKGAPRWRSLAAKKHFSSSLGGADTLARIPDDGYRGCGEIDCTRRPGMDVNSSATNWVDRDNRPGLERKPSRSVPGSRL